MSSILYGCESWLDGNLKPVVKLYNWGVKQLLGVRMSTCNELCYLELGMPPLSAIVRQRQRKFIKTMWRDRNLMTDDPLIHVLKLSIDANTPTSHLLNNFIHNDVDDVNDALEEMILSVQESMSSRRITYISLNPNCEVHDVYTKRQYVNDVDRACFTKLRVSAHSLAVETGRWNRRGRGRLPLEERLCPCGAVQTERHVVEACPLTHPLRVTHQFQSWEDLMDKDVHITIYIANKILSLYKQ